MKYSTLFTKTRRQAPANEESKNAQLLIRAGFIHKELAGVYTILPLGLRVMRKIEGVIRDEMNGLGAHELFASALQSPDLWSQTNRWDAEQVDIWLRTKLQSGSELGLAFTHEEPFTHMMCDHIDSYRDLPKYIYQFQTKFRNEIRSKSGILRGREFMMKDLYSFSLDQPQHDSFYEKVKESYFRIFDRLGLGDDTFLTLASGGSFSRFSHEFQTLSDIGEDTIYLARDKRIAINKEVMNDEVLADLGISESELVEHRAVEVGNIFTLGTRFSDALGLSYKNENGESIPVFMGSYGIGVGRVMGMIVEMFADDKGIVWPETVAPFSFHLISIDNSAEVLQKTELLYNELQNNGHEVLWDDRTELSAGQKLADADLLGIPTRIVISERTLVDDSFEVKPRGDERSQLMSFFERDRFFGKKGD